MPGLLKACACCPFHLILATRLYSPDRIFVFSIKLHGLKEETLRLSKAIEL